MMQCSVGSGASLLKNRRTVVSRVCVGCRRRGIGSDPRKVPIVISSFHENLEKNVMQSGQMDVLENGREGVWMCGRVKGSSLANRSRKI